MSDDDGPRPQPTRDEEVGRLLRHADCDFAVADWEDRQDRPQRAAGHRGRAARMLDAAEAILGGLEPCGAVLRPGVGVLPCEGDHDCAARFADP